MSVPILFALIGSIILVGFLANLLFRLTKIPSVLVLIAIGVVLGPVTGWIRHDALLLIAPYFGAVALLVILFEGGLELDVAHVLKHAPRTTLFTVVVFGLSMAAVAAVGQFALGLSPAVALMLGAILGATSPAICIPVVSGLSIREDVKTVVKLEAAFGEVLLLVSVVLLLQGHHAGTSDASSWIWGFARSLAVALVVATVAGVVWSRLVGWLGREPLSYMLTLGVTCLLYFVVEELGGSPAIAVLLFGLLLANMQYIAGRVGPHLREAFGIHVKDDQFVLGQFMVNITAELSFLVRTFFFVYLGLLLNFSQLTVSRAGWLFVIFVLLLTSRRIGIAVFKRVGATFSAAEWQSLLALQPRGLGTAVVAFMPGQEGVTGSAELPLYAFALIVLSNLYMTVGVVFAERRIRAEGPTLLTDEPGPATAPPAVVETDSVAVVTSDTAPETDLSSAPPPIPAFSPASSFEGEPAPATLADWLARVSGLRLADRETVYGELLRSAYFSEPLFWIQSALGAAICALGLLLGQTPIVIGACLIVPLARPVLTTGLALAAGDLYLLVKLALKLGVVSGLAIVLSMWLVQLAPLSDSVREIIVRTHPTILDFLVSLFGGMSAAALVVGRRTPVMQFLPGAVVVLTLVPALCVTGFALAEPTSPALVRQAALQFSTNLFAAILGASVVLVSLGVHRAVDAASVRQWKADELSRPLARAVFRRLGVEDAIGGTGSVRARVVVIVIFLLLILTPLQLAFNDIRTELRIRQSVTQALNAFNVPNRSMIVGSTVGISDQRIDVRLQLATATPFSADERASFEAAVRRETGRDVRLDLVQGFADVGDASALRMVLQETTAADSGRPATVQASLQTAIDQLSSMLATIQLPDGAEVIGVDGRLLEGAEPGLEVRYLAPRALTPDAERLLTGVLSAQTRVPASRTTVTWIPSRYELRVARRGMGEAALTALAPLRAQDVAGSPLVSVGVSVAEQMPADTVETVRRQVQDALALSEPPAVSTGSKDAGSIIVTLTRLAR